jgi:acetyltransferase-like isoleucine patch superfamily enzyme
MRWSIFWKTAGDRLRALRLRGQGANLGPKVSVGPGCRVWGATGVTLGTRATLEGDVWFKLVDPGARLAAGAYVFFGRGCHVNVRERVEIGAHCLFGPRCVIVDHNHGIQPGSRIDEQPCIARPIRIGADVWCGAGAVILPGVTIGDGAVVGAQSVVTRNVPSMAVVAGNPARVLRMRTEARPAKGG